MVIYIFGSDTCKYCKSAKDLLSKHGISYVYIDWHTELTQGERDRINEETVERTLPKIYLDSVFLKGGYASLSLLDYNVLKNFEQIPVCLKFIKFSEKSQTCF